MSVLIVVECFPLFLQPSSVDTTISARFLARYFHGCDIIDSLTGKKNLIFEQHISDIVEKISSLNGIYVTFTTLSELVEKFDANQRQLPHSKVN